MHHGRRGWRSLAAIGVVTILHGAAPAYPQGRYGGGERDPQPSKATLAIVGGMLIDGHENPPV
jgi:hypothetical protein